MSIRLGSLHKALVYGVTITLAVTGLLWLVPHFFLASKEAWGAARHPVEPWALRLHGAAGMAFLVALGSMLPVHVRRAWQVRRNVRTGVTMLGAMVALIATGYALYYGSSEELRPWISATHWSIGLVLIPFMILHDRFGKNIFARQQCQSTKSSAHPARRGRNPKTRSSVETVQRRVS